MANRTCKEPRAFPPCPGEGPAGMGTHVYLSRYTPDPVLTAPHAALDQHRKSAPGTLIVGSPFSKPSGPGGQRRWQESFSPSAHSAGSGHNHHHLSFNHLRPSLSVSPPCPGHSLGVNQEGPHTKVMEVCYPDRVNRPLSILSPARRDQERSKQQLTSLPRVQPRTGARLGDRASGMETGPADSPGCGDGLWLKQPQGASRKRLPSHWARRTCGI